MKKNQFTITEILITVSLVAILAGSILVTTKEIRQKADIVQCASNMRQLGQFYTSHASTNDWRYPTLAWIANTGQTTDVLLSSVMPGSGTPGTDDFLDGGAFLPTSMTSVNACPGDENPEMRDYIDRNGVVQYSIPSSYGYNLAMMVEGWGIDKVANPSALLFAYDANGVGNAGQEEGDETDGNGSGKNNNGHGNNDDDVDSSNPGESKEGEDTNPDVDDETKGGYGDYDPNDYEHVVSDPRSWQDTVYDNVNKRHLNDANYLFLDGSVRYGVEITEDHLDPGVYYGSNSGDDSTPVVEEPTNGNGNGNGNGNKNKDTTPTEEPPTYEEPTGNDDSTPTEEPTDDTPDEEFEYEDDTPVVEEPTNGNGNGNGNGNKKNK